MSFVKTPRNDMYSKQRIGGFKAVETGFIIFGNGQDEILEYIEAPVAVAMAWRDALAALLADHRGHRPIKQIDWLAVAAGVDQKWAVEEGWTPPETVVGPTPAPATPSRPNRPTSVAAA